MKEVVVRFDTSVYAERICVAWQSSIVGIIECGKILSEAKAALPHGQFIEMVENDLPFKRRTAHRLMAVAQDSRLSDGTHVSFLPASWGTLYELTKLSDEQFEAALSDGIINPEMERGEVSDLRRLGKREEYVASVDEGCVEALEALISAGKKYTAITADPPWSFNVYSGKGKARSADRHYDCASLGDIKSLGEKVLALAAPDCALFLWAVMPELPGALDVIAAWGFTYKTVAFTWVKQNRNGRGLFTGMGYWTRANAELCLLATRGSPHRLAKDVHQVVLSPVGQHSRKPDEVAQRIERLVSGPYLEMFGRRAMPGWTVWGNEVSRNLFQQNIPIIQDAAE
jgi:N6-adenosine-specific RNA methylase IME4